MYLSDYHTHTLRSPDSDAPLDSMARAAEAAGLAELCVTDHCDLLNVDGVPCRTYDWPPRWSSTATANPASPGG